MPVLRHGRRICNGTEGQGMSLDRLEQAINDRAKARAALEAVIAYANSAAFGGWRQAITDLAKVGLK